jgi:putative ABC transport system permease protein
MVAWPTRFETLGMFNVDLWLEIFETVSKNKLRTVLTGLAVAWGIFMLVALMGAGSGLEHGASHEFNDDATNSIWIHRGKTSKPWQGQPIGRDVQLDNGDHEAVARRVHGVEHITSRYNLWGNYPVTRGNKSSSFDIRSVHPDHQFLEKTIVTRGRFIDDLDVAERRKVVVIGKAVEEFLFGREESIGQVLQVGGIAFRVVGVFEDVGSEGEMKMLYLPISTAQQAFNGKDKVHSIMFTLGDATPEESKAIEREATALLAQRHDFSPDDPRAIRVRNNLESAKKFSDIFLGIGIIVWLVGVGTILAGVVGVSNIMLIAVKERTREFGIRKALGATPASIIGMVVLEAVVITSLSGYLGLLAGVGLVEAASRFLPPFPFFRDPTIDFGAALTATALLVVSGALAGFFPAWRAARVNPVEALRDE